MELGLELASFESCLELVCGRMMSAYVGRCHRLFHITVLVAFHYCARAKSLVVLRVLNRVS